MVFALQESSMKNRPSPNIEDKDELFPSQRPNHAEIAFVAYQLYLESGQQDGHDQEHCFRAEQLLTLTPEQSFAPDDQSSASPKQIHRQATQTPFGDGQLLRPTERSAQAR